MFSPNSATLFAETIKTVDTGFPHWKVPLISGPAVGLSVGLIVAALAFVLIVYKCVIARLGKWARRRVRSFGKTMVVFVQSVVTLPAITQMPIPIVFVEVMRILKIPALDLVLDNLGLACVVQT